MYLADNEHNDCTKSELEQYIKREENAYKFPKELKGVMVSSIEEPRQKIPADKDLSDVKKGKHIVKSTWPGFDVYYSQRKDDKQNEDVKYSQNKVAYGCGWQDCSKITIGPPIMEIYDELGPLAGSAGIKIYCGQCEKLLDEIQRIVS